MEENRTDNWTVQIHGQQYGYGWGNRTDEEVRRSLVRYYNDDVKRAEKEKLVGYTKLVRKGLVGLTAILSPIFVSFALVGQYGRNHPTFVDYMSPILATVPVLAGIAFLGRDYANWIGITRDNIHEVSKRIKYNKTRIKTLEEKL